MSEGSIARPGKDVKQEGYWEFVKLVHDVEVRHRAAGGDVVERDWKRGEVKEFSWRSQRNLLRAVYNAGCEFKAWICLTYPAEFPRDGVVVKGHLHELLDEVGKKVAGVEYLWCMEFQERGAPHFHVLVSEWIPKLWLSRSWFRIVGSGDPKHLRAGTKVQRVESREGAGQDMASVLKRYSAKKAQKVVPETFGRVGRFWGCSYGLVPKETVECTHEEGDRAWRVLRKLLEHRGVTVGQARKGVQGGRQGYRVYGGAEVGVRVMDRFLGGAESTDQG